MDFNIQFTRGNDKTLKFHFSDPEDVYPIDLTDAIGMVLIFFDSNDKQFAKFSQETISGYSDIDLTDAANGNITVNIEAEQTLAARPGQVSCMFKVTYGVTGNSNGDADYGFNKPKIIGVMNDSPTAKVITHP